MDSRISVQNPLVIWLRFTVRMSLFALAIMWPAGSWYWWEAWVMVGLWTVFGAALVPWLLKNDPALLAERMKLMPFHRDQKVWDKLIMTLFFFGGIALYIVPGFDVVRFGWSEPFPVWMKIIAILVQIPCFYVLWRVMRENTFLAQVVKIDKERNHHVITTGPYARVRHPMYSIVIILLFAVPVLLGSRYALIVSCFLTVLLVVRTWFEDRTLQTELPGYTEYTQQTPYRLVPGIW